MKDLKNNLKADAIGNLYRVALFLAQGNSDRALSFLKKSAATLSLEELGSLLEKAPRKFSYSERYYWAEKALDQYKYLSRFLS